MFLAAAEAIGPDARRALSSGRGEIAAVFRRSFYVRIGNRWACAGAEDIGRGPLNLVLRADRELDWQELLAPGQAAGADAERLWIEGQPSIDLAGAEAWLPPPAPAWDRDSLGIGLAALDRLLDTLPLPAEGLGCFARTGHRAGTPVARAAEEPVGNLSAWLADYGPAVPDVSGLLGLGPGLTPSGDDFLAGVLAVLHAMGRVDARNRIWATLESALPSATGPISAAHLRCAAEGRLSAGQHQVLNALLAGDSPGLDVALRQFSQDHTSSWDGLAGMVTALRPVFSPRE